MVGDEGGSEGEEEENSSGCWDPDDETPNKDCIHLDNNQPDLLLGKQHLQMQQHQEYKCHPIIIDASSVDISCNNNNNNLPYNFHQAHHHRQQHSQSSNMSYFQNENVIMSLS